jgi:hypothetical protein
VRLFSFLLPTLFLLLSRYLPILLPARFLTERERAHVIRRLAADTGAAGESLDKSQIKSAFLDWRTYVYMLIYIGIAEPLCASISLRLSNQRLTLNFPPLLHRLPFSLHSHHHRRSRKVHPCGVSASQCPALRCVLSSFGLFLPFPRRTDLLTFSLPPLVPFPSPHTTPTHLPSHSSQSSASSPPSSPPFTPTRSSLAVSSSASG